MISILIPVYNEQETIQELLRRVEASPFDKEVIIVDDGSDDGTAALLLASTARRDRMRIITHARNRGKGAAIKSALPLVSGDIVVIQDSDLEYDPREYDRILKPILDGRADVVYGSRFVGGREHRVLYFWHYAGNKFLTLLSNMFTNLNLTDMETGCKAFRTDVLRQLDLEQQRFGFEPEVTAKIARMGCRVYEVGISYSGRTYQEGKKVSWRDGYHAIWCIVKYGLLRKRRVRH